LLDRLQRSLPYCDKGVKRLEYRGYDSAGVMIYDGDDILLCKTKGKVVDLEEKASNEMTVVEQSGLVIRVGQHMVSLMM
jgi:glucosamine--fructose-6-phosphate aminotransferase (isomerizing)